MRRLPAALSAALLVLSLGLSGACGGETPPNEQNRTEPGADMKDEPGSRPGGNQPESNISDGGTGTGSGRAEP